MVAFIRKVISLLVHERQAITNNDLNGSIYLERNILLK